MKKTSLGASATQCKRLFPSQRVETCVRRSEGEGPKIAGPVDVCRVLKGAKDDDREAFYSIYLSTEGRVNGVEEVARGTLSHVDVHPREVFKGALAANSHSVIVAHNHPSGNPAPSESDFELTDRLVKAGDILGIPVLDHVVVARECVSLREERPRSFEGVKSLAGYRASKRRRAKKERECVKWSKDGSRCLRRAKSEDD